MRKKRWKKIFKSYQRISANEERIKHGCQFVRRAFPACPIWQGVRPCPPAFGEIIKIENTLRAWKNYCLIIPMERPHAELCS